MAVSSVLEVQRAQLYEGKLKDFLRRRFLVFARSCISSQNKILYLSIVAFFHILGKRVGANSPCIRILYILIEEKSGPKDISIYHYCHSHGCFVCYSVVPTVVGMLV